MVATAIYPPYTQIGHQTNTMIGKGASQRSIFSLIIIIISDVRITSINTRERPIDSFTQAKIQDMFAILFTSTQGPI